VAMLTRGDDGELEQRRWHAVSDRGGDMALGHGGEAGDGFGRSRAWHSDRRCRLQTVETAAGRRFVARARARPCQLGTARGTPGGDNTLTSGPGAEREKLTGGTLRQILFRIKNTPERK
jgi:hypothetical protein